MSSRGPTILYCAPSNKAVNVGACMYEDNVVYVYTQDLTNLLIHYI